MHKSIKQVLSVTAVMALVGAVMAGPASAADRLTVKDTGGAAKFAVQDTGRVTIGGDTPVIGTRLEIQDNLDIATQGAQGIFAVSNNTLERTRLRPSGIQHWLLNSGTAESGKISYSTPGGGVGIVFYQGPTYNLNASNIASYPDISGTPAFFAGFSAAAGLTIAKNTAYVGIGTLTPTSKLDVAGDRIRIQTGLAPAQGTTCNAGDITWGAGYIYVCTAANTWMRAALSSY